ncbi:cyclic nucleotide-binding domain-containing protein [Streptomyces sp. DSM 41534]
MNAPATAGMLQALPAEHRHRLMRFAREVSFPQGTRLFEEGGKADRFWIIRTGSVTLAPLRPAWRRPPVTEPASSRGAGLHHHALPRTAHDVTARPRRDRTVKGEQQRPCDQRHGRADRGGRRRRHPPPR